MGQRPKKRIWLRPSCLARTMRGVGVAQQRLAVAAVGGKSEMPTLTAQLEAPAAARNSGASACSSFSATHCGSRRRP